jgi:hypothetical protein
MRIHTLAGDVIDLRFLWPPGTLHLGRQAARRYAERMEHVITMRQDPSKADGWEVLHSVSVDLATNLRTVNYTMIPALTTIESDIPNDELWVRDKVEPMANEETYFWRKPYIEYDPSDETAPETIERAMPIIGRYAVYIDAALSNNTGHP